MSEVAYGLTMPLARPKFYNFKRFCEVEVFGKGRRL